MAVFVTTGGKTKRTNSRFNGETAWRQHADSDKSTVHTARRRAEQHFVATTLEELDADVEEFGAGICICPEVETPVNGFVRDGQVTLNYRNGRLLSAHCG
jgi:hypothetical protein